MSEVTTIKAPAKGAKVKVSVINYAIADALKDAIANPGLVMFERNEDIPAGELCCISPIDLLSAKDGGWEGKHYRMFKHSKRSGFFLLLMEQVKYFQENWDKTFPNVPFLDKDGRIGSEPKFIIKGRALRKTW